MCFFFLKAVKTPMSVIPLYFRPEARSADIVITVDPGQKPAGMT